DQDLRADAAFVLDHALAGRFAIELAAPVKMNLRQRAGLLGRVDGETAAGVMEVQKDAAIFSSYGFQRERNEFPAIARGRAKDVSRQAVRMDANEGRCIAFESAANKRDVLVVIHVA